MVPHSNGGLLALPANIISRWECMEVANTLDFYNMATFTSLRSFIVHSLSLIHLGKATSLPLRGLPESSSTWAGSGLICNYWT
jgi:hypothetical protein